MEHQLQTLESRLQGLTEEDKDATEEELAGCRQLIQILYHASSQSEAVLQSHSDGPSSSAAVQPASTLPQAQLDAHSNSSQKAPPLLLGPPS